MRLTHLSSLHSYAITVGAVDADKRESARTAPRADHDAHAAGRSRADLRRRRHGHLGDALLAGRQRQQRQQPGRLRAVRGRQPEELVHGQTATVTLASQRSYVFTVRALDSARLSERAGAESDGRHDPHAAVHAGWAGSERSDDHSAVLEWSPSTPVSGEIVGYRVFRDGIPVGQSATPGMTLESLAPSTAYQVTVVAVDSLGAISAPTAPLEVQTAPPTQSHGHVQAFLLASTDQSFDDLQAHYQQIGVVYPTYFECGAGGAVTGDNDPLVTGWAEARGVAVMPRLNCQNPHDENQILNEPAVAAEDDRTARLAVLRPTATRAFRSTSRARSRPSATRSPRSSRRSPPSSTPRGRSCRRSSPPSTTTS